ncbi:MAG: hypothetical protein DI536_05625 [Archangium gephyra]|uniref:DUF3102 domain-containing protein n=1 Tax=Archangium gephyra TaxID=48 RepID=A0A2W5V5L2_9BACT|nr:MAG: hypothetical protein DI536_05625 [Archangium gephyra]
MSIAEEAISQKASDVQPGSFRHTVLLAARRFKSSWVELGKLLTQVRHEGLYQEWGYGSFEAYCLAELRIKKGTADKLTRNFSFLEKHEPQVMKTPELAEAAPAFEVVEVLAQAEGRGQLSATDYKSIRDSIWNQEKPTSELRRDLTEKFPAPEVQLTDRAELKRLWSQTKRLVAELAASKNVPDAVKERAAALEADLAELATARDA